MKIRVLFAVMASLLLFVTWANAEEIAGLPCHVEELDVVGPRHRDEPRVGGGGHGDERPRVHDLELRRAQRRLRGRPFERCRAMRRAIYPDDDLAGHGAIVADPGRIAETQCSSRRRHVPMQNGRQ